MSTIGILAVLGALVLALWLRAALHVAKAAPATPGEGEGRGHTAGNAGERVAVCIAGNARTFHYPFMHATMLHNIVRPLRNLYDTDVFFIIRTDDIGARQTELRALADASATMAAVRKFHAVNVTLITSEDDFAHSARFLPRSARHYERLLAPAHCGVTAVPTVRLPHALFRARQCLSLIEAHERRQRMRYDWVYRLRPDVLVFDRILLPAQLRRDRLYTNQGRPNVTDGMARYWSATHADGKAGDGPIADQMSMSSRVVAGTALRAFDALDDCDLYNARGQHIPEGIYRFWMMKRGIRYQAVPFDWVTVREHIGPECYRLYFQTGEHTNWTRSMARCYRLALVVQQHFPKMDNMSRLLDDLPSVIRRQEDMAGL